MITEFTCKNCSQPFTRNVFPSSEGTFEFCSPSCRNKGRGLKKIPCPICGKMFKPYIVDTYGRKRHCSQECGQKSRRGRPSPKRTPDDILEIIIKRYPKHGAHQLAETLNMSVSAIQQIAYKQDIKLDPDIYYEKVREPTRKRMTENNPMFQEETKKKVAQWRKNNPEKVKMMMEKIIAGQRKYQKGNPTKLELKLFSILDELSIDYEPFYLIKPKFIVDVKIDNLIIQADGEYWHGHPRFEPLTDRQIKQQRRDKSQDAYLKKCGYSIVRIWENELTYDLVISILKSFNLLKIAA